MLVTPTFIIVYYFSRANPHFVLLTQPGRLLLSALRMILLIGLIIYKIFKWYTHPILVINHCMNCYFIPAACDYK